MARRASLRADDLIFIAVGVVPGAVIGGRIGYGLLHLDYYATQRQRPPRPGARRVRAEPRGRRRRRQRSDRGDAPRGPRRTLDASRGPPGAVRAGGGQARDAPRRRGAGPAGARCPGPRPSWDRGRGRRWRRRCRRTRRRPTRGSRPWPSRSSSGWPSRCASGTTRDGRVLLGGARPVGAGPRGGHAVVARSGGRLGAQRRHADRPRGRHRVRGRVRRRRGARARGHRRSPMRPTTRLHRGRTGRTDDAVARRGRGTGRPPGRVAPTEYRDGPTAPGRRAGDPRERSSR